MRVKRKKKNSRQSRKSSLAREKALGQVFVCNMSASVALVWGVGLTDCRETLESFWNQYVLPDTGREFPSLSNKLDEAVRPWTSFTQKARKDFLKHLRANKNVTMPCHSNRVRLLIWEETASAQENAQNIEDQADETTTDSK